VPDARARGGRGGSAGREGSAQGARTRVPRR
jgi:hypothetical protein